MPTSSSRGMTLPAPAALAMICSSTAGESLQPQPPPWDRLVSRTSIMRLDTFTWRIIQYAFMSDEPLAGKVMLVTGASSGIGRAIALGAARAGADVAIT